MDFILIRGEIMLFNLFSRRNKNNENSKPYLTKELIWDDEKNNRDSIQWHSKNYVL